MSAIEDIINLVEEHFDVTDQDSWGIDGDNARSELSALRQRVAELEAANAQAKFDVQAAIIDVRRMEAHNVKQAARIAELEAEQAIVTPNNCRHCKRAAEKMRESAEVAAVEFAQYAERKDLSGGYSCREVAEQIRSLPLPACDGCNPLAPSSTLDKPALDYDPSIFDPDGSPWNPDPGYEREAQYYLRSKR